MSLKTLKEQTAQAVEDELKTGGLLKKIKDALEGAEAISGVGPLAQEAEQSVNVLSQFVLRAEMFLAGRVSKSAPPPDADED